MFKVGDKVKVKDGFNAPTSLLRERTKGMSGKVICLTPSYCYPVRVALTNKHSVMFKENELELIE